MTIHTFYPKNTVGVSEFVEKFNEKNLGVESRQSRKEKSAYVRRPSSLIAFRTLPATGDFSKFS